MINVGFLGCAHVHAEAYVAQLAAHSLGGQPVAVFDHDESRARAFAQRHNLLVAKTPEALCEMVDAAIITAAHVRYGTLAEVAATAGVPVLCEKPAGTSIAEARRLSASGDRVSMAFPVRYAHALRQAKAAIEAGGLGELLAVSGYNHAAFPGGFFGNRRESGGGALIDHVVHLVDAVAWLTGCTFATVFAEAANVRGEGDVEDSAQVVVTTEQGAWISVDPSWSRPQGMAGDVDFAMTMWFEHGQLVVDAFARRSTLVTRGGQIHHQSYGVGLDRALLTDWLDTVARHEPPPIPVRDGWRATRVALGALRSAETARVVDLNSQEWTL